MASMYNYLYAAYGVWALILLGLVVHTIYAWYRVSAAWRNLSDE